LPGRRWGAWAVLCLLVLVLAYARSAEADDARRANEGRPGVGSGREASLEATVEEQDAALRERIEEITAVGGRLEGAQARADHARARVRELGRQTGRLDRQIAEQEKLFRGAREDYRARIRAAYKGESLEGFVAFLGGWFGSGRSVEGLADPSVATVLIENRQDLVGYEDAGRDLRTTRRQISQTRQDCGKALEEQQEAGAELHRREVALDRTIRELGVSKARTEERLRDLQAAERGKISRDRVATGGGEVDRESELKLAKDRLVAEAVEPASESAYMDLYRASARDYGFGPDWYVLAAVGEVESDHGRNMGPSSAGAMGPMQFLPSTWETSGVDGNGDGDANIMDPEDAIPAAAGYLRDGGAPRDWYGALYSYNHADWYVKKVLAVAEAHRRLAHDESVGPYL
jgi:hypothetical protein